MDDCRQCRVYATQVYCTDCSLFVLSLCHFVFTLCLFVSLCVSLCLFVSLCVPVLSVTTQSTVVSYPVNGLDLTGIVAESGDGTAPIYDLFAVSNHSGGLGGGHYTAYGKNPKTSKWYVLMTPVGLYHYSCARCAPVSTDPTVEHTCLCQRCANIVPTLCDFCVNQFLLYGIYLCCVERIHAHGNQH